jgi:hypothetical protein
VDHGGIPGRVDQVMCEWHAWQAAVVAAHMQPSLCIYIAMHNERVEPAGKKKNVVFVFIKEECARQSICVLPWYMRSCEFYERF